MAIWLLPLFALAALAGIIYGIVIGRPLDDPNYLAQLAIFLILGGLFLHYRAAQRRNGELLAWLIANADAIAAEGAVRNGIRYTKDTELRCFDAALSFVMVSLKLPSRYLVVGQEPRTGIAALSILTSLLLGWWGIPWGPIYTVQTVARNIAGGRRITVGELLNPT